MFFFTHIRRGSEKNKGILTYIAEDVDGVSTEIQDDVHAWKFLLSRFPILKWLTHGRRKETIIIKRWNRLFSNVRVESLFLVSFGCFFLFLSLEDFKKNFKTTILSTWTTPVTDTQCSLRKNRKKHKKSERRPKFRPPSSAMFKNKESGPLPFQATTSILRWLGESQRLPSKGNKIAIKVVHYNGYVVL